MGAYYSTVPPIVESGHPNAGASPTIAPPPPIVVPPEAVASSVSAEERALEEANKFNKTLNQIAANTYDSVHYQLSEIQNKHVLTSEKLSNEIAERLRSNSMSAKTKLCGDEELALLDCLKTGPVVVNGVTVLKCDLFANKYHACALRSYNNQK